MKDDWWPKPLAHISTSAPWNCNDVLVAEVKSFADCGHTGHRRLFSALIPSEDVNTVRQNLAGIDFEVSSSGPKPYPQKGGHRPSFWVSATGLPRENYEPLILTWSLHNKTVLHPDPHFLMTYGLVPRTVRDGAVHWDDPAEPRYDVVKVSAPSLWEFPGGTTSTVTIRKEYLQDYLSLRSAALVNIFWEQRWGQVDEDIERALAGAEFAEIQFADRRFALHRDFSNKNLVSSQVWGARILAEPGPFPITQNSLASEGLIWPGVNGEINYHKAMGLKLTYVYVSDSVLADFEGREGFQVDPETGAVSFGHQWTVSFCERVSRDLIKIDLKKIYEGVPPDIIRHWHKFAVSNFENADYLDTPCAPNIASRAKKIIYAMLDIGDELGRLAAAAGLDNLTPSDFVGLHREALDYHGWWAYEQTAVIARHAPLGMNADTFLDRCQSLTKLVIEGLSEAALRKLLINLDALSKDIENSKALKLLDRIVCLAQVAKSTGLDLVQNRSEINQRFVKYGTSPKQPIDLLFSLYNIRLIASHKSENPKRKLKNELERFRIGPGEEAAGYGVILDRIYDQIGNQLSGLDLIGQQRTPADQAQSGAGPFAKPHDQMPFKPDEKAR